MIRLLCRSAFTLPRRLRVNIISSRKHILKLIERVPSLLSAMLCPKLKLYVVLGCKVSLIFMVIVLFGVGRIKGSYFIGGEIINCLFKFLSLMFSSKTNLISLPLKFY
jgi:hypothetical protein